MFTSTNDNFPPFPAMHGSHWIHAGLFLLNHTRCFVVNHASTGG